MPDTVKTVQYTIYFNTRECPGEYMVREWFVYPGRVEPGKIIKRSRTLHAARNVIPKGLTKVVRSPGDDTCIIETWI